jgi:hypothetical protein
MEAIACPNIEFGSERIPLENFALELYAMTVLWHELIPKSHILHYNGMPH